MIRGEEDSFDHLCPLLDLKNDKNFLLEQVKRKIYPLKGIYL